MSDLKQAAITAIMNLYIIRPKITNDYAYNMALDQAYDKIKDLPSTEPLTDKEQRIFLAAMERERKVCKQVDEECRTTREPYEDSLVHVCDEIERKVKGALWA